MSGCVVRRLSSIVFLIPFVKWLYFFLRIFFSRLRNQGYRDRTLCISRECYFKPCQGGSGVWSVVAVGRVGGPGFEHHIRGLLHLEHKFLSVLDQLSFVLAGYFNFRGR